MADRAVLQRTEFTTFDPAEAREFVRQGYGGRLQLSFARDTSWQFRFTQVDAGDFFVREMHLPADLTFQLEGRDDLVVATMLAGHVAHERGKVTERYGPGDVFLSARPGVHYLSRTHDAGAHSHALRGSLLAKLTDAPPALAGAQPRFLSTRATPDGARQWRLTIQFVNGLLASPEAAQPLVIAAAGRLLAATALAIFPNTATAGPTAQDRHDARSATVGRAVAFIDEHAHEDIGIADIAAAARVTERAVQLAFRRHLDSTPMDYLRRVRLDHAHRDLAAADPADQTVTAVAYRWGFSSPSRFATYYQQAYGVPPSHTLRG